MPLDYRHYGGPERSAGVEYDSKPSWRRRPLTPAQLLVHDVRLETWQADRGPMLEVNERACSTLIPDGDADSPSAGPDRVSNASNNPIERQRFSVLEEDWGWLQHLRLPNLQQSAHDPDNHAKLRWIHCSSKFPEYLSGFLWGLSNDANNIANSMRMLELCIQRQTRFSKHGKHFAPFSQSLQPSSEATTGTLYPMLISVPFLDWATSGPTPPLRFQVDRREGSRIAQSSSHVLRSVLQWYFRLEDTADREGSQVFAKHKPWSSNRELDLKVRQWYGHYPSRLNVDELWILAVDANHIVTFSTNQTWKSRWPPLQLTSRIAEVSFRGIRNTYYASGNSQYTAATHAIASLSGAVGMLHRNFWPDMVLCLADRYAGRLGHLQFRLHRSPNTKLVMELIACQEELNIVIQITEQQLDMIGQLQAKTGYSNVEISRTSPMSQRRPASTRLDEFDELTPAPLGNRATFRQISTSNLLDPAAQLLDNLQRELVDLQDLRDRTDKLVTRTIQLVNIRLEDSSRSIVVFTIVTIIFLPLNFVSSFFGMNFSDIRNMSQTQWLFWAVAICVTVSVVGLSLFVAFYGGHFLEKLLMWRGTRSEWQLSTTSALRHSSPQQAALRLHQSIKDS